MLEAKQSPSCHHLSLTAVEADLKAADSKVTSSKTDPFLLQNLHMEMQGEARTVHRSSEEFGARCRAAPKWKQCRKAARLPTCPRDKGRLQLHLQRCLSPLATESKKRARSALIPRVSFCRCKYSDFQVAFMPSHASSQQIFASFWVISSLDLDSPFTLFCFVVFAFLSVWFAGRIKVFLSLPSLQGWNLTGLT